MSLALLAGWIVQQKISLQLFFCNYCLVRCICAYDLRRVLHRALADVFFFFQCECSSRCDPLVLEGLITLNKLRVSHFLKKRNCYSISLIPMGQGGKEKKSLRLQGCLEIFLK